MPGIDPTTLGTPSIKPDASRLSNVIGSAAGLELGTVVGIRKTRGAWSVSDWREVPTTVWAGVSGGADSNLGSCSSAAGGRIVSVWL